MSAAKRWSVDVYLSERDGQTYSEARLRPADEVTLIGSGLARLNPRDTDVPEIGDELATARALTDLAHKLLHAAVDDIEGMTHNPVTLSG